MEHTLPLAGRPITRLLVDHALSLESWIQGNSAALIRIEVVFTLIDPDGRKNELHPDLAASLAPILQLFGLQVENAIASSSGKLTMRFSEGWLLEVLPHPAYEAWEVAMEDQSRFVCMPGGQVAVFRGANTDLSFPH